MKNRRLSALAKRLGLRQSSGAFPRAFICGFLLLLSAHAHADRRTLLATQSPPAAAGGGLLTSLVAFWTLDEASNTSRSDSSGHSYTLTDDASDIASTTGIIGDAASFGTGGARLFHVNVSDFNLAGGSHSFSFWVNAGTWSGDNPIISKYGGSGLEYAIRIEGPGTLQWILGPAQTQIVQPDFDFSAAGWHHVVCVFNAGLSLMKVYVDGVSANSTYQRTSSTPTATNAEDFTLGNYSNSSQAGTLDLDEVAVWKGRALTSTEVLTLYNSGAGLTYPF